MKTWAQHFVPDYPHLISHSVKQLNFSIVLDKSDILFSALLSKLKTLAQSAGRLVLHSNIIIIRANFTKQYIIDAPPPFNSYFKQIEANMKCKLWILFEGNVQRTKSENCKVGYQMICVPEWQRQQQPSALIIIL
jgi:hypothetical protein